jgi:actin related protein 2/3 complex subunit 3
VFSVSEQYDIIDETLDLFRANSLFRNFEIKGPADRLLIVLILYVSDCLAKIGTAKTTPSQIEASKLLNTLSVDSFAIPGDAMFVLNSHYAPPSSRQDAGGSKQARSRFLPVLSRFVFQTTSVNTLRKSVRNWPHGSWPFCMQTGQVSQASGGCPSRSGGS